MQIIPSFYFKNNAVNNIISSTTTETKVIQDAIEDLLAQLYVDTATWGLSDWEKLLGLQIDTTATNTDRRARIKMALRGQGTFTKEFVQNLCKSWTNGTVEIIENNANSSFVIKFTDVKGIPSNMEYLKTALDTYKPAHLNYNFEYKYNIWDNLATQTVSAINVNLQVDTLKNELSYNPNTWAEWEIRTGVAGDSTGVAGDSTGLAFTANGSNYRTAWLPSVNFETNTKYGLVFNIVENSTTVDDFLQLDTNRYLNAFQYYKTTDIGNMKKVFTTGATISYQRLQFYCKVAPIGNKIKIKDIRVYELPPNSQIETDFNTLTADQLATKYPFASGIASVGEGGSFNIISRGKNLFDGKVEIGTFDSVTGNKKADNNAIRTVNMVRVKPNTSYIISNNKGYTNTSVYFYDGNKNYTGVRWVGSFTTSSDVYFVNFRIVGTDLSTNIQLEEGTIATPYEPYQGHTITVPTELRAIGAIKDEIKNNVLTRRVGKVVLNGSENNWRYFGNNDTYAYMALDPWNGKSKTLLVSDKLSYLTESEYAAKNKSGIFATNSGLVIVYEKTNIATIGQFKQFLSQLLPTVLYELATPTVSNISTDVLNIENNTIVIDSTIQPTFTVQPAQTKQLTWGLASQKYNTWETVKTL